MSQQLPKLKSLLAAGKVILVAGTGVSSALTSSSYSHLSWKGLVLHGLLFGSDRGLLSADQLTNYQALLGSSDMDDLLVAAEFLTRKLGGPTEPVYGRWLQACFGSLELSDHSLASTFRRHYEAGSRVATVNYDTLLESALNVDPVSLTDVSGAAAWLRRERNGVLHLHGVWSQPSTCVLGVRDYESTLTSDTRDLFQRSMSSFEHLLFVGCGDTLEDPNFSRLLNWLKGRMNIAAPMHYALVREDEVPKRLGDATWQGFVEPISYGTEYEDLEPFLRSLLPPSAKRPPSARQRRKVTTSASRALDEYRSFLIRDCGTMTIEGVKADMDTAQRRFDLERLFVPLGLLATPPEISESDPLREQKLKKWEEENSSPLEVGTCLGASRKLALLALPGGGKTILLKRLAVAYADADRRKQSTDNLPELDVFPVLIRCREWRTIITKPLQHILSSLGDVTGKPSMEGFFEELTPLLKAGKVLLLVDGLDEIHADADRSTFVENLEKFLDDYPRVRLIVTSREAGFSLVAPTLARFCTRFKVAPLSEEAITALCGHWHRLMGGQTPEAAAEAAEVAKKLIQVPALRRLAENPLLLTMLLVVKHGAGRLPPDRVNLYGRAVDVLLDTWNIKGHEALNVKEAVPQLAFVAYEMMAAGKQTATERELLALLEQARESVPQIRRYARDTPYEFLKRVELRSSLLVEAGHQKEGYLTVPFYQFRHLTFQEYLAAVAAAEGHYTGYNTSDTLLDPLGKYLVADEWKEVIPMAAVLARKQAEPLLDKLVRLVESDDSSKQHNYMLEPQGVSAVLLQCLVEEAEATSSTLERALLQLALVARGCHGTTWGALLQGPYGEEFVHQAWSEYVEKRPQDAWLRNTVAAALAQRAPLPEAQPDTINAYYLNGLQSDDEKEVRKTLLTICGGYWSRGEERPVPQTFPLAILEKFAFREDEAISEPAIWAIGLINNDEIRMEPTTQLLDDLCDRFFRKSAINEVEHFALESFMGLPRKNWTPALSEQQCVQVRGALADLQRLSHESGAAVVIAFHARNVVPDGELAARLTDEKGRPKRPRYSAILRQLATATA